MGQKHNRIKSKEFLQSIREDVIADNRLSNVVRQVHAEEFNESDTFIVESKSTVKTHDSTIAVAPKQRTMAVKQRRLIPIRFY
jgi:hypothetical protein